MQKSAQYTAVSYTIGNQLVVSGSDKVLRVLNTNFKESEFNTPDLITAVYCICLRRILFLRNYSYRSLEEPTWLFQERRKGAYDCGPSPSVIRMHSFL